MIKRRFLSAFLVGILCLLALFSGCSNQSPDSSSGEPEVDSSTNDMPDKLENPNVSLFIWDKPSDELKAFVKSFENKYGGKVTLNQTTWGEMDTKVVMAMAGDNPPDLVWAHDGSYIRQATNNVIQPIDEYIDLNDPMWDAYSQRLTWKGKHYVPVPKDTAAGVLVYFNKTKFENSAVKTPLEYYEEGNWTFETFQKCATEMTQDTDGDNKIDLYGWGSWRMLDFVYANNGDITKMDADGQVSVSLDDAKTITGLQFLKDAYQKYKYAKPDGNMTWATDMQKGNVAMVSEGADLGLTFGSMQDEWDVVPFPVAPDNTEKNTVCTGAAYTLSYGTKNVEGAVAYLKMYAQYLTESRETTLKKVYSDEQIKRINAAKENPFMPEIETNFGVWGTSQYSFMFSIAGTQPVSQAIEQWKPILQSQIDKTMKK